MIQANVYRFTPDGKCVVRTPFENNLWMRLLADVMFEVNSQQLSSISFNLRNFHLDNVKYPAVESVADRRSGAWVFQQHPDARSNGF